MSIEAPSAPSSEPVVDSSPAPALDENAPAQEPASDLTASPSPADGIFSDGLTFRDGYFNDVDADGFDEYRSMAAQFKDLPSLFKSLKDTKAALSQRQDGMVKLPNSQSTEEEIAAYRDAIGIPESVDGYELTLPEASELPEGIQFQEGDLQQFREFAHKNGIAPETASALLRYQAQVEGEQISQIRQEQQDWKADQQEQLRNEWGGKWEQNQMLAKRAAETFGLGADHPLMENAEVVKAMANAAAKISESSLVAGESITSHLTPGNEARDILANPDNALHAPFHDSSHPNHETAVNSYMQKMEEQARRDGFSV